MILIHIKIVTIVILFIILYYFKLKYLTIQEKTNVKTVLITAAGS